MAALFLNNRGWSSIFHFVFGIENGKLTAQFSIFLSKCKIENTKLASILYFAFSIKTQDWKIAFLTRFIINLGLKIENAKMEKGPILYFLFSIWNRTQKE